MLVDSHCHLDVLDLDALGCTLEEVIQRAEKNDVKHILCPGVTLERFPDVLAIAERFSNVSCAVALHPSEEAEQEPTVDDILQLAQPKKVVGIGETGLDYYYQSIPFEIQRERFRHHIQAACEVQKPLIIHSREATDDTLNILKEEGAEKVGGTMHCFTESLDFAKKAMDMGFYISFSGIVTFKNALALKEIAKQIPIDRLLIETDAPYLTPVPIRSKPNEPANVRYTAEYLAQLRNVSFDEIALHTTENYFRLFGK